MRSRLSSPPASHPRPPASHPRIVGWLDGHSRGRLHGWVHDRNNPFRRLAVEVNDVSGHRLVALADRYRADVHQSGLGDGYDGFSVPVQRLPGQGTVHVMCIDPRVDLGAIDLSRRQQSGSAKPRIFERGSYILQVDPARFPGHVGGWAIDRSRPERRRVLRLCWEGRVLAQQRATLYREDIADGGGDLYRGYSFALPAASTKRIAIEDIEGGQSFSLRR